MNITISNWKKSEEHCHGIVFVKLVSCITLKVLLVEFFKVLLVEDDFINILTSIFICAPLNNALTEWES